MSLKWNVLYNTFVQFVGRFATSFLGFITTIILARSLGAAGYGTYAKVYTLAAFFYLVIDFGLNAIYIRRFKEDLKHISMMNAIRTVFFIFSLAVIFVFFVVTQQHIFTSREKWYTLLFVPTILLFGYYTSLNAIFQLKLRYDLSVLAAVLGGLVGVALMIITLSWGLSFSILSIVAGYAITVFLSYLFARKLTPFVFFSQPFSLYDMISFLKDAAPIGFMLFFNTMYVRADVFVLSAFKTNAEVGIYQLGYKFFEFPLAFATFFANATFPHFVKKFDENKKSFWKNFYQSTFFLLGMSVLFSIVGYFGAPLLSFIRNDYSASVLPLQVMAWSYPIFFLTSALNWLLFIEKRERSLVWIYAFSFVANVLANWYFIPRYSYMASAWITVIGEMGVLVLILGVLIRKQITNHKSQIPSKLQ